MWARKKKNESTSLRAEKVQRRTRLKPVKIEREKSQLGFRNSKKEKEKKEHSEALKKKHNKRLHSW